jgi:hypothetical protein
MASSLLDPVASKVAVNMNFEGLGDVRLHDDDIILCARELPALQVLDGIGMGLPWFADKPGALMHRICNLWASTSPESSACQ